MHNYFVFVQKETMELLRTKRLLGLLSVFAFFAFTSPLLARYITEFIALMVPAEEAIGFLIPDPVWTDSYAQFYSNISQIGNIVLILLFMGVIAAEKQLNTIDLMVTKGLGFTNFVFAKFTVLAVTAFFTIKISILINYLYTGILFDTAGQITNVLMGALVFFFYMLLVIALTLFASAIAKSTAFAALLALAGFLAISAVSAIPRIGDFLPGNLHARSMEVTTMGYYHQTLLWNIASAIALAALFLGLSVLVLKKQEGE